MRKIILSILILLLLLIFGAVLFFKNFDVDRFRPQLVQAVERVTGNSVKIGKLSLAWRNGLALDVDGAEIFERGVESDLPVLQLQTGGAVLQLLPLLQKQIKLASLDLVGPSLEIVRSKQGEIQISGVRPPPQPPTAEDKPRGESPDLLLSFFIAAINIRDGRIIFRDEMIVPPAVMAIRNLNISFKDVSLDAQGDFRAAVTVDAAILGSERNLTGSGRVSRRNLDGAVELSRVLGEFDLSMLNVKELEESVPALKSLMLQDPLSGKIKVNVERLLLTSQGLQDIQSEMTLNEGRFRTGALAVPVEAIEVKAAADDDKFLIETVTAKFAGGTAKFSARMDDWQGNARADVSADLENIALENFLPPLSVKAPQLHGRVNVSFSGKTAGLSLPEALHALTGEGRFALKDGVILNLSILRSLLDQLVMFPGLVSQIEAVVPEDIRSKLQRTDTIFEGMESSYRIQEGRFLVPDIGFKTDAFESKGSLEAALEGPVTGEMIFTMSGDVSAALVKEFPRMKYLESADRRVVIPAEVKGDFPGVLIVPDVKAISSRLATGVAEDLMAGAVPKTEGDQGQSDLGAFDHFVKTATESLPGR